MVVSAQNTSANAARRKRINRLKKIIIGTIMAAILIPLIGCGILMWRVSSLKEALRESEAKCEALLEAMSDGSFHLDDELFPEEIVAIEMEEIIQEEPVLEEPIDNRKVYLTFDDGPSENTEKILEILAEYDVKATFFVTGQQAISHPEWYQAIVDAGHTLGMHSYSHRYGEIYRSEDEFGSDLLKLQSYIENTTGITPVFYRFPGGSSNTVSELPMSVFCDYLTDNSITYFDWNVSSKDAVSPMRSSEEIVQNCTGNLENFENAVILLHDASNKTSTVEALPDVIEKIMAMENTQILPITEETVVVHH